MDDEHSFFQLKGTPACTLHKKCRCLLYKQFESYDNYIKKSVQIHLLYNLRNNNDFFVPLTMLLSLSRFPLFNLPRLWNSLPNNLKAIPCNILSSRTLKTDLFSQLNSLPVCACLFCPACARLTLPWSAAVSISAIQHKIKQTIKLTIYFSFSWNITYNNITTYGISLIGGRLAWLLTKFLVSNSNPNYTFVRLTRPPYQKLA